MPDVPRDFPVAHIARLEQMLVALIAQHGQTTDPEHATHLTDAIADLRTIIAREKDSAMFNP
jgi:hypothetical protein